MTFCCLGLSRAGLLEFGRENSYPVGSTSISFRFFFYLTALSAMPSQLRDIIYNQRDRMVDVQNKGAEMEGEK
jgi:hypothetical protein